MITTTKPDESRDYTVAGMTCSHCVMAVHEKVSELPTVSAVDVDLSAGRLTVAGTSLDDEAIRAAVAEAGYDLP